MTRDERLRDNAEQSQDAGVDELTAAAHQSEQSPMSQSGYAQREEPQRNYNHHPYASSPFRTDAYDAPVPGANYPVIPMQYFAQYEKRLKLRRFQASWYPKVNLKIARRAFSRVGFALLIYTVLTSVVYSIVDAGINFWFPTPQGQWAGIVDTLVSSGAQYFVGFPLCLLVMQLVPSFPPQPRADDQAAHMTLLRLFTIFVMSMPLIYLGSFLGSFTANSLSNWHYSNILESMYSDPTPVSMLIDSVITVIAAPIVEEIIFRKMIIDRLHRYGEGLAIGVSALLFALMHQNPYQFFYTLAVGAMWAYVYLRTGKIQYTIYLHMAMNFVGGVIPTLVSLVTDVDATQMTETSSMEEQIESMSVGSGVVYAVYGLAIIGFVIAGIVLWVRKRKQIELRPALWQLVPGIAARTAWLNVGMMLFVVLTVFATLVVPFFSVFG